MASSFPLPAPSAVSSGGLSLRFKAWALAFLAACLAWEKALDDQLAALRKKQAEMGPPPQFPEQPERPPITDTPWSHGNGGSQYGGGEGGGPGSYVTHPSQLGPGAAVYEAFRRRADAAAEALRRWQEENERRRKAGLPPRPWVGVGGF